MRTIQRAAPAPMPARGREKNGSDDGERKKKGHEWSWYPTEKQSCVALFFTKQVLFPTLLISAFGFLFCHMSHIDDNKWDKLSKHKWSKDGLN